MQLFLPMSDADLPILTICWILQAKSERLIWQPCIILAVVQCCPNARMVESEVLTSIEEFGLSH